MTPAALVASAVRLPAAAITGAVVSRTVTANVAGAAGFPAPSAAVHVTVVAAIGNVEPDAGKHPALPLPETASLHTGAV